jgi:5'-methylthioadenosine phosphorylase
MTRNNFAVITGTGVTEQYTLAYKKLIETRFGKVEVYKENKDGYIVIPRHGRKHSIPPHEINYRANISALFKLGVKYIVGTNAVGSIRKDFKVGSIGTAEQFLDFTKKREPTIFQRKVYHADMTKPYSERLNNLIIESGLKIGVKVYPGLVYACMEGPRYETLAEINMLKMLGADVVGMTGVPEVVYARELSIEYASILVSTNWAAGMQEKLSHEEVLEVMEKVAPSVRKIIDRVFSMVEGEK